MTDEWYQEATLQFNNFLRTVTKDSVFTITDFRRFCAGNIDSPEDARAFGGVLIAAKNKGKIKKLRDVPHDSQACHGRPTALWILV